MVEFTQRLLHYISLLLSANLIVAANSWVIPVLVRAGFEVKSVGVGLKDESYAK